MYTTANQNSDKGIDVCRYERNLVGAEKAGCRKGLVTGTSVGILWLLLFSAFSLAFWYGNKLVREEGMTGGVVLQVNRPVR